MVKKEKQWQKYCRYMLIFAALGGTNPAYSKGSCSFQEVTSVNAKSQRAVVKSDESKTDWFSVTSIKGGKACLIEGGNSTTTRLATNADMILFDSNSGSSNKIVLYDWQRCKPLPSPIESAPNIIITDNAIRSEAWCECDDKSKLRCSCHSSQIAIADPKSCLFKIDDEASDKSTLSTIRLNFRGTALISKPGTAEAKLIAK